MNENRKTAGQKKSGGRFLTIFKWVIPIVVLALLAIAYHGSKQQEKRFCKTINTGVASAYPGLEKQSNPQVVEILSIEGGSLQWTEALDRNVAVAIMELTSGESTGYRFRQRVSISHNDDKSISFDIPGFNTLLLQRYEEGLLLARLYISEDDSIYELAEYIQKEAGTELEIAEILAVSSIDGSDVSIKILRDCGLIDDILDDILESLFPGLELRFPSLKSLIPGLDSKDPDSKALPKTLPQQDTTRT